VPLVVCHVVYSKSKYKLVYNAYNIMQ
jgi:hypothetical protein